LANDKNVADINKSVLLEAGLVGKNDLVKVLGNGAVTKALNVTADAFSESAKSAIEAAGGKVETLKK